MSLDFLKEKLQGVFKTLRGYGKLSESNVADAVREVRLALLAADVNYQVAKEFCDEVLAIFSSDSGITPNRPVRMLLCGLNGAGKTTTAGKLAAWYKKQKQHVVLVAGDLARPAAIEQLQILGQQVGVTVLTFPGEKSPEKVAQLAREEITRLRAEVAIFDAAGRLDVDDSLLAELEAVGKIWEPQETLLVADAATGQSAVKVAQAFQSRVPVTGM